MLKKLTLGLLIIQSASAWAFPLGGRLYTDQYLYTQPSTYGHVAQSSVSLWLELNAQTENGFGMKATEQIDAFYRSLENRNSSSTRAKLREGYGSYQSEGVDLRIGQQIIPWGKSDGVNPTDYFTAKDYRFMTPDEEVRREGAPALNFSFTPDHGSSPFTLQTVIQAYYPQTHLLIPDQAVPQGIRFTRDAEQPSAFRNSTMEAGIKLSYAQPAYDFSLSYFRGHSKLPEYIFDLASSSVAPIHPKESALGADASFTTGNYVVRLESALILLENGSDTDPLYGIVEPNHWDTVIGIERPFFTDFRVQFQFLLRQHLSYLDSTQVNTPSPLLTQVQRAVAKANSLILNFQSQTNPGLTLRVAYAKENAVWNAEVFLVGYFAAGGNFLLRPQVSYLPIDNLKFTLGSELYGGSPTTPLGALHNQSVAFFEGKYVF